MRQYHQTAVADAPAAASAEPEPKIVSIKADIDYRSNYKTNLFSNVMIFVLNIIIGLLLPSFFVKSLGVAVFGIVSIGLSLYSYVNIITIAINGSLSRFLMMDMQRDDVEGINRTFNTAFWTQLFTIVVLVIPVFLFCIFYVDRLLNIPTGLVSDTRALFILMSISFSLLIIAGVFTAVANAYNKVYLKNIADRIALLTYAILSPCLILAFGKSIVFIGIAYAIGSVATLLYSIRIWKRLSPYIKVSVKGFRKDKLKEIFGLGGWLTVNHVATVLFLNMDLFIINIYLGPAASGKFAAVMQWGVLIRALGAVVSGGIGTALVLLYTQGKTEKMAELSQRIVRLLAIFLAFPVGIICCFSKSILFFWLGKEYVALAPLMNILTFHLIVNVSVIPLLSIFQAYNKAKTPGIITLILGVINFGLSLGLVKYTDLGLYAVAVASMIVLTMKNLLFTTYYASRLMQVKNAYFKALLPGILTLVVIGILGTACLYFVNQHNIFQVGLSLVIAGGGGALIAYRFIIPAADRQFILGTFLKKKVA